jgi:phosphoglycolate phosphatase-like HAD superfamily hydrolase
MKKLAFIPTIIVVFLLFGCSNNNQKEKSTTEKTVSQETNANDPLPSWNDTKVKQRIIDFVTAVTTESSTDYVEPKDRIATFDNDGTMWCEKPAPFQVLFAFSKIKQLAPQHPEWKSQQPYKAIINDNMKALKRSGLKGILEVLASSHLGLTDEQYNIDVNKWLNSTKHSRFKKPYADLVYKPMLELIKYLQDNGFKTFIVSGGGIDFMRAYIPNLYDIPSYQIAGSYAETNFENGQIVKEPIVAFIDNEQNKPIAIYRQIGKRPILACGNSDGDLQMLEYSDAGKLPSLQIYIHHTDAKREYKYGDEPSHFSIKKGLAEAAKRNWVVVSMKNDWKTIFGNN